MKVLIYGNRKQDDTLYDISTPEKEAAAYLAIFTMLDKEWGVYADLEDIEELAVCVPCQKDLHNHCDEDGCICKATEDCKKRAREAEWDARNQISWKTWLEAARTGNAESAKKLLKDRSANHYEYEEIRIAEVMVVVR